MGGHETSGHGVHGVHEASVHGAMRHGVHEAWGHPNEPLIEANVIFVLWMGSLNLISTLIHTYPLIPPKSIQIVNRGRTTVSFSALPSLAMLQRYNIDVLPASEVLLRPRESADLTFFFK